MLKFCADHSGSNGNSRMSSDSQIASRLLGSPGELDELDIDQLTQIVLEAELSELHKSTGSEFSSIIENLDKVYTVKVYRYLSCPSDRSSLIELADHLSRVAADLFFDRLEGQNKKFGTRWKTLIDLIQIALRVGQLEQRTIDTQKHAGTAPDSWRWILGRVVEAGVAGLEWSALMEAILNGEAGDVVSARSKSGVSMLVTSMRHAGWLRVVANGRTRKLFAGNNSEINTVTAPASGKIGHSSVNESDPRILSDVVKSGTCFNQGAFLDFLLLASERHKAFKESLPKNIETVVKEKARDKLQDLCVYLHGQTQRAAENNFRFIDRYFELTRKNTPILPRISVKLVDRLNDDEFVLDLARNHANVSACASSPINSNTGFEEILRSGKFHLINDIAKEVFSQRYKNPRLRMDHVDFISKSTTLRTTGNITPAQWRGLWIGAEHENNFRSAYRSTLIVPITLVNSAVSTEFRSVVRDHICPNENLRPIDRTIMGFLCLDHVDPYYFNEASDVDIGYMFADWLSLFLFVRYMYTTMSSSFQRCVSEFSSEEFIQKLRTQIEIENSSTPGSAHFWSIGAPMSTRHNDVFPTDELQRAVARAAA